MTITLSWRVQKVFVIGLIRYEQKHNEFHAILNYVEISLVGRAPGPH